MSVIAQRIIEEAALAVGDPDFKRVTIPEWTLFFNRAARKMARRMRLVEREAYFDAAADDLYALPDDCIQVKWVRYNLTPSTPSTSYKLVELFESEFEDRTQSNFPTGTPTRYYARQGVFHLYPAPDASLAQAGHICYWAMPDSVATPSTDPMPFDMDFLRDLLCEGMIPDALKKLSKLDEAAARMQEWEESLVFDRDKMEDRSADRRANMRTSRRSYDGQV